MPEKKLSRSEVLDGGLNRSRRAAKLLAAIEARCLYMREESRRVVTAYLLGEEADFKQHFDTDYIQSIKLSSLSTDSLLISHLERFASQWKHLVPGDPDLCARVARLIIQKYGMGQATLSALGGLGQEVQARYQELFAEPLEPSPAGPAEGDIQSPVPQAQPWQDVETLLEWVDLRSGEILYRQGDPGDSLYVLLSGRLRVIVVDCDGCEHTISEVGRGEMVGEMAVLTGETRSATIQAMRDSELVRLCRDDLLRLAEHHIEVLVKINALIARRLRDRDNFTKIAGKTLVTYALVPTSPGVPLQELSRQLARAIGPLGSVTVVTCAAVDDAIETGASQAGLADPLNPQIVSWLSELESHYRYVIYEAAPDGSEWSRRCIRQADRIVLVGCAGDSPDPAPHETELLANETQPQKTPGDNRIHLVLLHDQAATSITGTAAWLDARSVGAHHHVRLGNPQDMAHLARCLTGNAIGLVLGGGGARGFAHVGVLRALEESGIEVDVVGGTSMGAIISGGVGMCMSWQQMEEIAVSFSSPIKLFDPTLPVVSLFTSSKVNTALHKVYGDVLIEDLWRPMFCVSSNLNHSKETVYRKGMLWKAVRASMAVPGIFAPVLHEGDVQVDGAVMNNVPVDIMHETGMVGTMITVNVMPLEDMERHYHFGDSISGPRAAVSLVNPYDGTSVPVIYETLVRVMALHEVHQEEAKRRMSDVYIVPPVEKYNILDFGSYAPIIELGYRSGQEALAAWKGKPREPTALRQLESTLADLERLLDKI